MFKVERLFFQVKDNNFDILLIYWMREKDVVGFLNFQVVALVKLMKNYELIVVVSDPILPEMGEDP